MEPKLGNSPFVVWKQREESLLEEAFTLKWSINGVCAGYTPLETASAAGSKEALGSAKTGPKFDG